MTCQEVSQSVGYHGLLHLYIYIYLHLTFTPSLKLIPSTNHFLLSPFHALTSLLWLFWPGFRTWDVTLPWPRCRIYSALTYLFSADVTLRYISRCVRKPLEISNVFQSTGIRKSGMGFPTTVWLAQLVRALAAPTHVRSCVQEVWVRSPELTSSTQASIPSG